VSWTHVTTLIRYLFVVIPCRNHMSGLCKVEGNIFIIQRVAKCYVDILKALVPFTFIVNNNNKSRLYVQKMMQLKM
jgi:hypothetical protein